MICQETLREGWLRYEPRTPFLGRWFSACAIALGGRCIRRPWKRGAQPPHAPCFDGRRK